MVLFDDLYVGIFFFGGGNYFVRCKAYMWEHFGMDICMQDIFFFFFFSKEQKNYKTRRRES